VSQLLQARYLAEGALRAYRAPRVDMLIQYLVRDEPSLGRWQSGLFLFSGRPKLSATEFPLPLVQAGRSGDAAVLWGQVRPGKGVQSYRLEARSAGESWRWLGGTRRTTPRGFVSVRIDVPRGTQVRLWSAAADSEHGVTVVVR